MYFRKYAKIKIALVSSLKQTRYQLITLIICIFNTEQQLTFRLLF